MPVPACACGSYGADEGDHVRGVVGACDVHGGVHGEEGGGGDAGAGGVVVDVCVWGGLVAGNWK